MKRIYFVRHGVTDGNEKNEFQHKTTPLSNLGLKQAEFVAERFKSIPIDIVISSDMIRASQTADFIANALNKEVNHTNLFQEIASPTSVRGKKRDDPEVFKLMEEVKENFENKDWRHSDEENFYDIRTRALSSLEYLRSLHQENILVVTHSHFLIKLIGLMCLGDTMTAKQFRLFQRFFIAKNTGITIVNEEEGKFFLITWNDHTHLGSADIKIYS